MRAAIPPCVFITAAIAAYTQNVYGRIPAIDEGAPRQVMSVNAAQVDSLASLLRKLEPKVAPLAGSIDSMVGVLRADSGTVRADSAFMRVRESLRALVRAIRPYDDTAFQAMALPEGVFDRQRRRQLPPAASAIAASDSLTRYLDSHGIWVYRAEGSAYMDLNEATLFRRLGPFLTESMQEYQRILIDEQARPTGEDASLMIAWDRLGERLARTDLFLATYPEAAARAEVRRLYDAYLRWYVLGSENTKAFDWRTRVLELEVHRSYERYAANHGSTTSGRIIRGYLELLRRNRFRYGDAVRKYILANTDWSRRALGRD